MIIHDFTYEELRAELERREQEKYYRWINRFYEGELPPLSAGQQFDSTPNKA